MPAAAAQTQRLEGEGQDDGAGDDPARRQRPVEQPGEGDHGRPDQKGGAEGHEEGGPADEADEDRHVARQDAHRREQLREADEHKQHRGGPDDPGEQPVVVPALLHEAVGRVRAGEPKPDFLAVGRTARGSCRMRSRATTIRGNS